ncbi:MAG: CocE/NonD family hydrolase [Euryarchaeota archaeon]|nr:CocE/NonD family hydrolase [Euryarchaeota archaeon]
MSRRLLAVVLLVLLGALLPTPSGAQASAGLVRNADVVVESTDGTELSVRLFWLDSADPDPHPLVITAHGWGGSKADRYSHAAELARAGYTVITYDARGFGASEGEVGLNGPDEVGDVSVLIDWALGLENDAAFDRVPPVATGSDGDPLIGMTGISYGGAIQLLAAAADPRIDAIVPEITWSDLGDALAPGSVVNRGWIDLLFFFGMMSSHGATSASPDTDGMDQRLSEWYLAAYQTGRLPDEAKAALAERSPLGILPNITAHTLLVQGYRDTLFVPDQAVTTYGALNGRTGSDTHLMLHNAGHGFSMTATERDRIRDVTLAFFAKHLKGDAVAENVPPVSYVAEGRWVSAETWPPVATDGTIAPITSDSATVVLQQSAAPSSHTQFAQFEEQADTGSQDTPLPTNVRLETGITGPVSWAGNPVVRLQVTPDVDDLTLFLSLVDSDGETSRVVQGQVVPLRIEDRAGETVDLEVALRGTAYTLPDGHRLLLRVATSDSAYLGGREAGTVTLALDEATLTLPTGAIGEDSWSAPVAVAQPPSKDAPGPAVVLVAFALLALSGVMRRLRK